MLMFYETGSVAERDAGRRAPSVRTIWPVNQPALHQPRPVADLVDVRHAASLRAPWRRLCAELAEENPFYEPWTLAPALDAYADNKVKLACVWGDDARKELIGFMPVRRQRGYARLPISYWGAWRHPHCFYAAPLVRRGYERSALAAFAELLCDGPQGEAMLRLRHLDANGALARAAFSMADADGRHCYATGAFTRAALCGDDGKSADPARVLRKKKLKELERLRNRLGELGVVSIRSLTHCTERQRWTEEFLALESRGWKGKAGTSLNSSAADTDWFRATINGALDAGKLQFMRLDLDDRPIAMLVNIGARNGSSLKTAYDPDFARYSPGVMLEIATTKRLLGKPDFAFMDSCAAADQSMINSLWRRRRTITGINIGAIDPIKSGALRLCHWLENARSVLPKAGRAPARQGGSHV